jgi:NAD(P)-dependent dehydrogenase (short-subunit alcohol dehydrogenase family)
MFPFEGRKVLVTGGAGGLGYAIVKKFLENGATVFALDNNEQRLKDLQTELTAVKIVHADLSKWKEVRETVENLGPMDHLVNNAGIAKLASCLETTEEQIDE